VSAYRSFRIYGDNIVECQRAVGIICEALLVPLTSTSFDTTSIVLPTFLVQFNGSQLSFQMVPGYGENRWNIDILKLLDSKGGLLREAPDSLITEIVSNEEVIRFAIEFCGALPAGNQAWQRNGRALSFAYSKVPYFYITELGGFELDGDRDRKAERVPNPLIPFSYINVSLEMDTAVLPIYIPSPGASPGTQKRYKNVFGMEDLRSYIKKAILGESTEEITSGLAKKTINLVRLLAESRSRNDSISAEEWGKLYEISDSQHGNIGLEISNKYSKVWSKKTSLSTLTNTFNKVIEYAKQKSFGVTSTNLPISIFKESARESFSGFLKQTYPHASQDFLDFIAKSNGPLAVAWIAGFKPRGDDARPDRGLSPLLRMSVGSSCDVIAVVYGPAPKAAVDLLKKNQIELGKRNGLWESIIKTTDGIIVDCKHDKIDSSTFVLTTRKNQAQSQATHTYTETLEIQKFGEQDVDTSLHIIFTKLFPVQTFEGLCNPPGGDWSGISLKADSRSEEYRWLTLPRVTATDQKRPDHIFQTFDGKKFIVIVESKDTVRQIEDNIGPRLIRYVKELTNSVPDIERSSSDEQWVHSRRKFDTQKFEYVSIASGVISNSTTLQEVAIRGGVDLVIGFKFNNSNDVEIQTHSATKNGEVFEAYLKKLLPCDGLKVNN
jgi:hypothetical protein